MIKIRHDTVLELTAEDKQQISSARNAKREYVSQVMRFLEGLGRPDAMANDTSILREEAFLEIPPMYRITASDEPLLIMDNENRVSTVKCRNEQYELELRQQSADKRRVQRRQYSVPIGHPLPLSYSAQSDLRYGTNETRPGRLEMTSDMSVLFSEYHEDLSDEEKARLKFLIPGSARHEAEMRIAARPHYRRSDPTARARFNEPPKMPNLLHNAVSRDFVPPCASKTTRSSQSFFFGEPLPPREPAPSPYWRY